MNKTYFGRKELDKIDEILKLISPKNIFLVTGKKSYQTSGAEEILSHKLKNYKFIHFNNFQANPKIEDIKKGIEIYNNNSCDITIAVGGGSVIDVAKTINSASKLTQTNTIEYLIINNVHHESSNTLIALPTTAGSGSESTHFAVVYIGEKKYSYSNKNLLPNYVFLVPDFLKKISKYQFACSAADALCQAIESYWAVNSNAESKNYAIESIKLIKENLFNSAVNDCYESKSKILLAANLSGKAINISKTTGAHAISYSLTSFFNIPHGHSVSIFLPIFIKFNYEITENDCNHNQGSNYVKTSIKELSRLFELSNPNELPAYFVKLFNSIGLTNSLKDLNILTEKNIDLILNSVNLERSANNPRKISYSSFKEYILNEI
tara:strand:+ start:2670 stop:3806 length:1137 start_codon:yes stop_codon:yes gene_type:complete